MQFFGVLFPPTLEEVYELIKLGERNLCKHAAENSQAFRLWKSIELANGWVKTAGLHDQELIAYSR
jgi:hypothetical protein